MAKLSEQILSKQESPRITRTERVIEKREGEKKEREFEILKAKAERLRRTEFSNITSIEEYEEKYSKLDPAVKPFFAKPSELKEQQQTRILSTTQKVKDRIEWAKQKKQEEYDRFQQDLKNFQKYKERAKTQREKENYDRKENKRYDEWEEDRAYYENYIKGLNEGYNRLSSGEDLTYNDVLSYAEDLGNYERETKELRNKQRIESSRAYERLIETSPYAPAFKEYEKKYSSKIDWTNPKNVSMIIERSKIRQSTDKQLTQEQKAAIDKQYKELINEGVAYPDFYYKDGQFYPVSPKGTAKAQFNPLAAIKKVYDKIPSLDLYLNVGVNKLVGIGDIGFISPVKRGEGSINLREKKQDILLYFDEKKQAQFEKEITKTGVKEDLDKKFQSEYETRFYRSEFGKKAFYGEMEFEEAAAKFKESDVAKTISQKYQKDITQARAGKFTKEGFKIAGLGLAETGVKLVPSTVKGAVGETVLIYTGAKVLKSIPPVVSNIGTAAIGTAGTFTALSPTASPEAKAGGVITAGISFGILGYQGIRYLRQPTIKTRTIKIKPRLEADIQKGILTKEKTLVFTDIKGKTTVLDYYKANKLTEQIVYGRRTIVSTKWRDLLGLKPVYSGIPYGNAGSYNKAIELLTKRGGLTELQAKSTLRYYQPKDLLYNYQAEIIVKYGDLYKQPIISVQGTRTITQPSILIDKSLGIKTRGATSIKELIRGEGEILGSYKGNILYRTSFNVEKTLIAKGGGIYQKLGQAGKTTRQFNQITSATDKGSRILEAKIKGGSLEVSKGVPYELFDERSLSRQVIPKGKITKGRSETMVFEKEGVPKIEVDLGEITKLRVREDIIKQTKKVSDISKLQDPRYIREVTKTLKGIYGTPAPKISPVVQKLEATTKLKSTLSPVEAVKQQLKSIAKISQGSKLLSSLNLASASASSQRTRQEAALSPKLNQVNVLKEILKENEIEKYAASQDSATSQKQALKQILAPKFEQRIISPQVISPVIPTMPFVKIPTATIPTLPLFLPSASSGSKRSKKTMIRNDLLYLPDFTARSLGLEAETLSEKRARKKLKQLLTGLEIRRAIKIKY